MKFDNLTTEILTRTNTLIDDRTAIIAELSQLRDDIIILQSAIDDHDKYKAEDLAINYFTRFLFVLEGLNADKSRISSIFTQFITVQPDTK